ncbi:conserved protein of unknown function [uncultured Sphingopyxis sp.]|uniref:ABM domain-containing protein n=1 Tax=uncultured Sphingopyxis sp. TaxID=310581 RepID=A0A1Y5PQK8_9SPHN|nr:antibiotic biosynthesis monooxygenase family protein [uncultured Sphingopyxis sp.]SBV32322.1 conserved protein of unknown function [uncultured Sphingopyxis sp.]
MFSVIFELDPKAGQLDAYPGSAEELGGALAETPGFVDNIRYRSLTREGRLLSLSSWRDEKSLVRWRTDPHHQDAEVKGRAEILSDYHLRVGQFTYDTQLPEGCELLEQRLDQTEAADGTAITLIDASQSPEWTGARNPQELATYLGFDHNSHGDCISWDVLEAIATPGAILLFVLWKDQASAMTFAQSAIVPDDARVRAIRVVRDYSMFDRREAPQFFPDATGPVRGSGPPAAGQEP